MDKNKSKWEGESNSNELDTHIGELRQTIDKIDEEILDLINRRLWLVEKIGGIKKQLGRQVLDGSREREMMERLCRLNQGPLKNDALRQIFEKIVAVSRDIQH